MSSAAEVLVLFTGAILGLASVVGLAVRGLRKLIAAELEPITDKLDQIAQAKAHDHRRMDERHAENAASLEHLERAHKVMRRAFRALLVMLRTGAPADLNTRAMSDRAIEELERIDDETDPTYWGRP